MKTINIEDKNIRNDSSWNKSWFKVADYSVSNLSIFISGGNKLNFHKVFQGFSFIENNFLISDISKKSWQEINWNSWGISKNANFGWNLMEGNHCFNQETFCDTTGLTSPTYEYPGRVSYLKELI